MAVYSGVKPAGRNRCYEEASLAENTGKFPGPVEALQQARQGFILA